MKTLDQTQTNELISDGNGECIHTLTYLDARAQYAAQLVPMLLKHVVKLKNKGDVLSDEDMEQAVDLSIHAAKHLWKGVENAGMVLRSKPVVEEKPHGRQTH